MTPLIAAHLATVLPALLLGGWLIFLSEKGARWHRALGALYLVLLLVTVGVTFFIRVLNHGALSWAHYVFIPLTLFGIWGAISGALAHKVRRHRRATITLYLGVLAAGAAAFLPGRLLFRTFIG